jgi:glucose/arabinose dehydrogenase
MNRRAITAQLAASLILAGIAGTAAAQPRAMLPTADEPLLLQAGRQPIRVELVSGNLIGPWDIEFLPDGETMLVTESSGTLRMIRDGRLLPEPLWKSPSPEGNDVLHGVVVHPNFARNGFVYASYTKAGDEGLTLAVSRGRLRNDRLVEVREILVADAWENASNATAGRMIFGPDGTLYVSVGDRDRLCCGPVDDNSIRIRAQSLEDHVGKVLRITDDGGIPRDNPFVDRAGAKPEIFTYGNRNAYGFDFHPETGELWELEIGPMGGDELNILEPGGNYGWPLVSMGRNYSGTLVSEQPWWRAGMVNPRMFWVPAISPSSIRFYRGDRFPDWKGSLFVTSLSGQQVQRVSFGLPGQAERREPMLAELGVRFRDVAEDRHGNLYFATELRYGSRNPDGAIIRIVPAE